MSGVRARLVRAGAIVGTLLALGAGSASAQGGWAWERPRPQGNTLRDACVDAAGATWAVGDVGTLGSLGSDGRSWEPLGVEPTDDLHHVACCPRGVIAVGAGGTAIARDASGVHVHSLGSGLLTGVACVGDRGVAISSGSSELWISADAGTPFERRAAPHPIFAVHALGEAIVVAGPDGAIARSTDLGRTFTAVASGTRANLIAFAGDERDVVAVGARGAAVRSTDGGATWSVIATGTSADLRDVARGPRGETVAVAAGGAAIAGRGDRLASIGALGGDIHAVVATARGWLAVGAGGRVAVRTGRERFAMLPRWEPSLYATWSDGRTFLVVGDRGFVARAEGSGELAPVRTPVGVALHAVTMSPAGIALAVGAQGTILRSTDRGRTWRRIPVPADRTFNSVWMDDAGHALAAGERGQRYRSDDAGASWTSVSLGNDVHFTGIASRGSTLWVTALDRIERSDDLGRTWVAEQVPGGAARDLRTPFVSARGSLIVSARPGTVHRRTERGWTSVEVHPSAVLTGLSGSADVLVAVASDGSTFVSRDEGVTWVAERRFTREVLTSVRVAPDGRAHATGYWGSLLVRRP